MFERFIHGTNIFITLPSIFLFFLIFFRIGRWAGIRRREALDEQVKSWIGIVDTAILTMLALFLGFTFVMANTRYDTRRNMIIEDSNAIGTTYLRTQYLTEPYKSEISNLLRQYIGVKLGEGYYSYGDDLDRVIKEMDARSNLIHDKIWAIVINIANDKNSPPIYAGLFIQSVNNMIDVHSKRMAVVTQYVPMPAMVFLFIFSVLTILTTGYYSGMRGKIVHFVSIIMVLILTLTITLIIDLDHPNAGLIKMNHQIMLNLQHKMNIVPDIKAVK